MHFSHPYAFFLLLGIPLLILYRFSAYRRGSQRRLRFSTTDRARLAGGGSWRRRLAGLPFCLRLIALLLLIIALAGPRQGLEKIRDINRGVAIEMVVDRSGSMGAEMETGTSRRSRLEVVKQIFQEFVLGNGDDLAGRPNDLIGLVTFARFAETACPLTLSHNILPRFIEPIALAASRAEDGTAIGDALALAAARLRTAEETLARQREDGDQAGEHYRIKSKVIILLTDGEHNAGRRTPEEAAALARKWGIRIYAVGVGGDRDILKLPSIFGTRVIRSRQGVNSEALSELAEVTGGIFRLATDGESLREVYAEIDRLEKSEMASVRYLDYREYFTPFALAALALLALEILLACTLLRRIP